MLAIAAATIVGFASTVAASTDTTAPPTAPDSAPAGTETAGTATAETGSVAIDAEWWATAAEPYAGTTITGVSESTPPSVYAAETLAAQFEELTGITVELETTSWDEMRNRALNDMESGTGVYDFVYIEQDIAFADISAERLTNLTAMLEENADLQAPGFSWDNFNTFVENFTDADGNVFGVPMEAFIKIYLYRTDLFGDPEIQAAFEEQYGYALEPATTHEQYRDIAEFFTVYGEEQGEELWGTTVQGTTSHAASFYEFFESVAPTFGLYDWGINAEENFAATVENGGAMNGPEAVAALEYWLSLLEFAPPESTSSTWDEVASTFAAGRAAQGLVYGENVTWIAADDSLLERRRQRRRRSATARRGRTRSGRIRRGLHRLLRRRLLRHPRGCPEQGSGAALAPVPRPSRRPAGVGGDDRTGHSGLDLRVTVGRRGRRGRRRLLHAAARRRRPVQGRAALRVPLPGGDPDGAVHLECHPRREHCPGGARRSCRGDWRRS